MGNPILIGAKLNLKRSALNPIADKLHELLNKRSDLEKAVDDAKNEEELTALEKDIQDNQTAITEAEQEKATLEQEIKDLETELERSSQKKPSNRGKTGDEKKMDNVQIKELRSAVNAYIRSKGAEVRAVDGFKLVDGGALVPVELLTPEKAVEDTIDLLQYVKDVPASRSSGKYPVIKKSGTRMNTVAELEANPELAKPTITEVTYSIETYRGYIPVSQEVIDDADYDIVGLVDEEIQDQEVNTRNYAISTVFKTATPKAAVGLDDIITLLNTGFKTAYQVKLYVSQSLFNALDLLKDGNGRYMLQDDVTVASGKRLKGKEIVVLDDDMIGTTAGDLVGFVGDAKAFCKFFNRKQVSVKWVDHNVYGQMLAAFVRFDVKAGDTEAGYYLTYTPAAGE
jgi:HK97 family phage major capsid protein